MAMRSRRTLGVIGAAVGAGLLLRGAVAMQLAAADPTFDEPLMDGRIFLAWAGRIAGGEWAGTGAWFFNPLYAWFLAPFVALFGDGALAAGRVAQALLGVGTVLLLASATRRLLGRREAVLAAALGALWPALVYFEGIAIGATLGVFVNALALDLLARWRTRPTRGRLLGAGAALGVAVLGRPNVILFPAALPPWLARSLPRGERWRRAAAPTALLFAGVALPLLPGLVRNLAVLGEPVVTTTSMGVNLHLSNNPLARETGRMDSPVLPFNPFLLEGASRAVAEAGEGRTLSPTEVSSFWTRRAVEEARAEPGATAGFLLRKGLYFCGSAELPSSESFAQGRRDSWILDVLSVPLGFGIALPFALLGCVAVVVRRRRALPLVLLLLVYAFGLVIFFPLAHYRLPVLPALLPLAAAGVVDLADAFRGRRGARAGWRIGALLAAGLLSHGNALAGAAGVPSLGPFPEPGSWILANRAQALVERALARERAGDAAGRDRALAEAETQARRARDEAAPGDNAAWLVHAAFARIARARRDLALEEKHLGDALTLMPGQPQLLADLARVYLATGRVEMARRTGLQALRGGAVLDPEVEAVIR